MNWGHKIILAFMLFVIFLGLLVYRTMNNKVHLVSQNYYQKELNYQQEIDKLQNEQSLLKSVDIDLDSKSEKLSIRFPEDQKITSGIVELYRPSDADLDVSWELQLNQHNEFNLYVGDLPAGLWEVKLEWLDHQKAYLKEQKVFLP